MPRSWDVERAARNLSEIGALNLDTTIGDLLRPEGIGIVDPTDPVSDNAVAWSDYVLITKGKPAPIREIGALADVLRGGIEGPGR